MSKGGHISFRNLQSAENFLDDPKVKIYAPEWVKSALTKLTPAFKGAEFTVGDPVARKIKIQDKISLAQLVAIARSERANTTGVIAFSQYQEIPENAIIALRDLAKHCVIVGKDVAMHFGGYPSGVTIQPLNQPVYICDLPGLQFQEHYNTGRHVLLTLHDDLPKGILDKEIFQHTVGEPKWDFAKALRDKSNRFVAGLFNQKPILFDTIAYRAFVAQDVVLAATALNAQAKQIQDSDCLNFKFLKYGAGFFAENLAGQARTELDLHLTAGVLDGLNAFFALPESYRSQIKRIELPFFYSETDSIKTVLQHIEALCKLHTIEFSCVAKDALAPTSKKWITATTNCSDPHAPTGNEMQYGSVDAAIAENLKHKGNQFNPVCNAAIQEEYFPVEHLKQRAVLETVRKTPNKLQRLLIIIGAGALTASVMRLGLQIGARLAMLSGFCTSMFLVGLMLLRDKIKNTFYQQYKTKSEADIKKLTPQQQDAFDIGLSSGKSYLVYARSFFKWNALMAPKAYYAGLVAAEHDDKALADRIKTPKAKL